MMKRALTLLATVAMALPVGVLLASPAQAHSGCAYPYVCLWDVRTDPDRKLQYQDFGVQPLAVSNAVDHVMNTRNDDVVRLWDVRTDPDSFICIPPNTHRDLGAVGWGNRADRIEIRSESRC